MTAPHGRGDAPSHPIEAPSTEAARALLDAPDVLLMQSGDEIIGINEGELELQLAAIEAAARDEGRREAVRDARRLVERHTDAKESRDSGDHCTWECYIPTFDDFDHEVAGLNVSESPRHGRSSDPTDEYDSMADYEEHMAALGDPDLEAGRSSDPEPAPDARWALLRLREWAKGGADRWADERRNTPPESVSNACGVNGPTLLSVNARAQSFSAFVAEIDAILGAVPALQATPSGAIGALHEKGITGSRLDDIRARAKAGQPMKSWSYYVGNGMMDAYQPFVEEAQEDRLTLLAAVEELLAERAALQATGEAPHE